MIARGHAARRERGPQTGGPRMTTLKLLSYTGVAAIALAAGSIPSVSAIAQPQPQPPKPGAQPQAPARRTLGDTKQICRDAEQKLREMRSQINALESQLDHEQTALANAKGEARVDALAKTVNEIADTRKAIDEKLLVIEALISGHMAEHIRDATSFEDLKHDLAGCAVAAELERTAARVEQQREQPAKTPGK
jgi:hypothetical protein